MIVLDTSDNNAPTNKGARGVTSQTVGQKPVLFRKRSGYTPECKMTFLDTADPLRHKGPANRPIVKKKKWNDIPHWIALYSERGETRKCWNGCPLKKCKVEARGLVDGKRFGECQTRGCTNKAVTGATIYACKPCRWSVCETCNDDKARMQTLAHDPLFHGPDEPCLLSWPSEMPATLGTVIICPGGNYEFLSPLEGLPVVKWLAEHGIGAVVLRHRLLPRYGLDDSLDDLEAAAQSVRKEREGPVCALGFSAGGHLIASLALRSAKRSEAQQPLDAQVLVYPGIDATDWRHPEYNGFFNGGRWSIPKRVDHLFRGQPALIDGVGFAAPPSCVVGSTEDTYCVNAEHTDIYVRHLDEHGIPNKYVCGPFGEHGFQLKGGWTPACIEWLHSRGFGESSNKSK